MLKRMAWNTFKNTGNINTMMELLEVDNIQKTLNKKTSVRTDNFINEQHIRKDCVKNDNNKQ